MQKTARPTPHEATAAMANKAPVAKLRKSA